MLLLEFIETHHQLIPQIIYIIASLFGMTSFMFTDILLLRSVYLLSSLFFIISGILFTIPVIIATNLVYVAINIFQIIRIILERSTIMLPKELKPAYEKLFTDMYPRQFLNLTKLATKKTLIGKNRVLIDKGSEISAFCLTLQGDTLIERDGNPPP